MLKKQKNVQQEIPTEVSKKRKDKRVLFGILGGLLLMFVVAGVFLFIPKQTEPVSELVDCPLYWNVDREKYQPKLGGLSTRQPEEDGIYTMRFLTRGEIVEYRVKDKELMLTIDSEDAMGLLVDEDGFVTEYVELIDMGVREVASWYYVLRPGEDSAVINTSTIGKGVNIDLKWQDETGFWDVTNKEDYGCSTKLELLDAVRVFNNADGKITDVFVVEREPSLAGLSPDQYCPHCKKVVTWTMWAFLDSFPSGEGHYWIVHDINTKRQYSMAKDVKQCVNLNGKTVTATHKKRLISLHNEGTELAIMDLSEEQTGTLKGLGDGGMGSIVWLRFGKFDLYSGTLDASEVVTSSAGAAVNVFHKDAVFNMHGGTIIGGTVKATVNDKGKVTDAVAGAVAVKGTANMYGGTIRGGKVVTTKDKAGNKGASAGGNVFVYKNATFNMYGGTITGGTIADNQVAYGGNVRVVPGATWNMYGGVIKNGVSFNKAGNFSLFGTLNMYGGTITGGKVMTDGESLKDAKVDNDSASKNLHIDNGTLNMTGGTIAGYANVSGKKSVLNISGTAKIAGGKSNLTLPSTNVINMGRLKKGAKVYISGGGFVTSKTSASNRQYVFSDYDLDVLYEENKLLIGKYACICGEPSGKHFGNCDGTKLAWTPWVSKEVAPASTGNWYLLTDVNLTRSYTLGKDTQMNLDLNGFRISGEAGENGARVYSLRNENVKMQLTDHSAAKTGSIVAQGTGNKVGYGNCIWVAMDSELHMYGGCLDASKVDSTVGGTAVQVHPECEFYMFGGSIKGGTSAGNGGAVAVSGVFEMYDGIVSDGKAKDCAGNIYTADGGVFKLYGGEVRNGEAANYGGNLGGKGQISISGGIVDGGKAEAGGNVWAKEKLTIEGGSIKNGKASYGGNIFAPQDVKLTITGGTISKGEATYQGGNIRVLAGAETVIKNAIIRDGQAGNTGGNIYMNGGTFTMESGKILGGTVSDGLGANLYVIRQKMGNKEENATLNLKGGVIDGEIYLAKGNAHNLNLSYGIQVGHEGEDSSKPYGISWNGNLAINGNEVNEDAKVVLATIGSLDITGTGDERAFTILDEEVARRNMIADDSNGDGIGNLSIAAKMCVCGKTDGRFDHTEGCKRPDSVWQPWTDTTVLPIAPGSYYLTQDMTGVTTRAQLASATAIVNLDLAGHKVEGSGNAGMLYRVQAGTFNIADSSKEHTGAIKMTGTTNTYGSIAAWGATSKSTYINIFGGTYSTTTGTVATLRRGHINMYGGTILPGAKAADYAYANAVQVGIGNNQLTDLKVFGGTIKGEVLINDHTGAALSISNDAKVGIADGEKAYGIATTSTVTTPCTITCTDVTGNIVLKNLANLTITGTGEESAFTILDTTSRNKIVDDNKDGIGNLSLGAYMCVCGKTDGKYDHTDDCRKPAYAWQPWTSTTGLPTENGSFYLTQNLTGLTTRSQIAEGKDINLDLAGYTVEGTGNGGVLYRIQRGSLNLADSSAAQTGAIRATGASTGVGRALYVWGNQGSEWNANIFGGTLSAEAGVPVAIGRGNIHMYGGNILAGTSVEFTLSADVKFVTANSVQVGLYTGLPANLKVAGGTITGEVLIGNETSSTVAVSDNAKIGIADGTKAHGIGIISAVTSAQTITCDNVTDKASVVLKNSHDVTVSGTGEGSAFSIIDPHNKVVDDNANGIGNLSIAARMCVCGAVGEHTKVGNCAVPTSAWKELSSWNISNTADGSYYLTSNITANSTLTFTDRKINIDLAGYTIDGQGSVAPLFQPKKTSVLNITDSKSGGTIKNAYKDGDTTAYATVILLPGGTHTATCANLYAGTLTSEGGTLNSKADVMATVYIGKGTFNMYGGTVEDNLNTSDGNKFLAVRNYSGTFNHVDGDLIGN